MICCIACCCVAASAPGTAYLRPVRNLDRRCKAATRKWIRRRRKFRKPLPGSTPARSPTSFRLPLYILAQRSIDACLVALADLRLLLEPGDDIGVEAQRQLLLDGPVEEATFGAR